MSELVDVFTIEIPKHLTKQIVKRGYDVKSWIKAQILELLEDEKKLRIAAFAQERMDEVNKRVGQIKDSIKVTEKQV